MRVVCGVCGTVGATGAAVCASCGLDSLLKVDRDAVVSFPAGSFPCPGCGKDNKPLVFRGWVKHVAFVFGSRESRSSGYMCADCARLRTAAALAFTGLLGWWGVFSFLFRAPRATFFNWLAAFRHPINPLVWGAIPAADVINDIRQAREAASASVFEETFTGSPLHDLPESQIDPVLSASGLYELLRAAPTATAAELRSAYSARAKEVHPDMRPGDPTAAEEMIRINQAWAILRDDRMRAAYDWLEAHRSEVFSS